MGQPQSCINEESLNFCSYNFVTGKFIFHIHITYVAKSSLISMILVLLFLLRQTTQVTCVHQLFYCSAYLHPIHLPFHHNIWVLIKSCLTTRIQITYNSQFQFLFHNCQFLYYYETQYRDFLQLVIIAITPKLNRLLTHYQNTRLV